MPAHTDRPANKLLRLLKPPAFERIASKLKPTILNAKQILYKPNQAICRVKRSSPSGNRDGLLKISCDCYAVIKENYEQVGR